MSGVERTITPAWSKIPALMEDRARKLYANMPGLISKAFVYDPDTREYGGNYLRVHRVAAYLDRGKV
jgi:hypothetical protein